MKKFTKTHEKQMREFIAVMDWSGCALASDWTSGSGRFTKPKALPPFVTKHERKEYPKTALPKHGTPERTAYQFFHLPENAKRKVVLVMDCAEAMDFLFEAAHGMEFDDER